ncbi:hypothetical protein F4821DRAFT_241258 [Hypoxylon rubiginosum]|uniref:Uncharacterized protein n=1 Tax=Hypoxylon rubiginosum TaxID=110542 RepID=A0ACC0CXV8_9PEZI|nr:hypothetical protein F4821DRAFT_241258 [Hypoxylon rubiginosum]
MSVALSPIIRKGKLPLVVLSSTIVLSVVILMAWLVIPRGQITMWIESSKSWLLSEFKGPYTPTEDLLILSSAFSIVVSIILETLLLLVLRHKSRKIKSWIRYTLYTLLSANAALAFAAFLCASTNDHVLCAEPTGYLDKIISSIETWNNDTSGTGSDGNSFRCGQRVVSRWLSLLISIFSTVILVSTWLDFREQDQQELYFLRYSEELYEEKGGLLEV